MTSLSDIAASAVVRRRQSCGLTRAQLAARCADLGHHTLTEPALANIETGRRGATGKRRREVTVDELATLAAALDVDDPWSLTRAPTCARCHGTPPSGFTCNTCGAEAAP